MSADASASKIDQVSDYITHHVTDGRTWTLGGYHLEFDALNLPQWFQLSGLMSLIGAGILITVFVKLYDKQARVPKGLTNLLETLVIFVRDEISIAYLGKDDGRKLAWLFLTQFFFILTLNLMGLIPIFSTATGVLSTTAALATTTFIAMVGGGIAKNGVKGFFGAFIPHGVPTAVLFILTPIELLGVFIKSIVLAIRLFANMLIVTVNVHQQRLEFISKEHIVMGATKSSGLPKFIKRNPANRTLLGIQFPQILRRLFQRFELLLQHVGHRGGVRRCIVCLKILFGTVWTQMQREKIITGKIGNMERCLLLAFLAFHFLFDRPGIKSIFFGLGPPSRSVVRGDDQIEL